MATALSVRVSKLLRFSAWEASNEECHGTVAATGKPHGIFARRGSHDFRFR
jgi:hypothetical protein